MSNENEQKQKAMRAALAAADVAYDQGKQEGFNLGLEAGKAIGFVAGVNSLKGALSDGLRHGSPECGRALESLKRLDALLPDDSDDKK